MTIIGYAFIVIPYKILKVLAWFTIGYSLLHNVYAIQQPRYILAELMS